MSDDDDNALGDDFVRLGYLRAQKRNGLATDEELRELRMIGRVREEKRMRGDRSKARVSLLLGVVVFAALTYALVHLFTSPATFTRCDNGVECSVVANRCRCIR